MIVHYFWNTLYLLEFAGIVLTWKNRVTFHSPYKFSNHCNNSLKDIIYLDTISANPFFLYSLLSLTNSLKLDFFEPLLFLYIPVINILWLVTKIKVKTLYKNKISPTIKLVVVSRRHKTDVFSNLHIMSAFTNRNYYLANLP